MITAVVNTLNEEANLARLLASLQGCADEIIVADMHSTDRTVEIAAAWGARVHTVDDVGFVEPARRAAIDQATHEWILVVDADEVIPPSLGRRLREVAADDEADAVEIHFTTYMFGAPNLHSGWSREREVHLRFFRASSVRLPDDIHVPISVHGSARVLRLPDAEELSVVHYNYTDWSHFLTKLDRYTTVEAERIVAGGTRRPSLRSIGKEFVSRYVMDRGYRAGRRGLLLALLMVCYRLLAGEKARTLREIGDRDAIVRRYDQDAKGRRDGITPS